MHQRLVVANWKMNPPSLDEARKLAVQIEHGYLGSLRQKIEVGICPPFVYLAPLRHSLHAVKLGAQDISGEEKGPFTGQISGAQLREFGVRYVIIGHSERRILGEDDEMVNKKIKMALGSSLHPILCVGYGLKKNSTLNAIKSNIETQVRGGLKGIVMPRSSLTVMYEPTWAISRGFGTGRSVDPRHAEKMISYIKELAPHVRTIYGGSVDATNAPKFAAFPGIEGALVGGASLHTLEFLKIIKAFGDN